MLIIKSNKNNEYVNWRIISCSPFQLRYRKDSQVTAGLSSRRKARWFTCWNVNKVWVKGKYASAWGQLILLEHPVDEGWPLDDCCVSCLTCLGPRDSPHCPSNSLCKYCLSDCAGTQRSNIRTDLNTDLEMAVCPKNVSVRGTVDSS